MKHFILSALLAAPLAAADVPPTREVSQVIDKLNAAADKATTPLRTSAIQQLKVLLNKYTKQARLDDALRTKKEMENIQWVGLWRYESRWRKHIIVLEPGRTAVELSGMVKGKWEVTGTDVVIKWANNSTWNIKSDFTGSDTKETLKFSRVVAN